MSQSQIESLPPSYESEQAQHKEANVSAAAAAGGQVNSYSAEQKSVNNYGGTQYVNKEQNVYRKNNYNYNNNNYNNYKNYQGNNSNGNYNQRQNTNQYFTSTNKISDSREKFSAGDSYKKVRDSSSNNYKKQTYHNSDSDQNNYQTNYEYQNSSKEGQASHQNSYNNNYYHNQSGSFHYKQNNQGNSSNSYNKNYSNTYYHKEKKPQTRYIPKTQLQEQQKESISEINQNQIEQIQSLEQSNNDNNLSTNNSESNKPNSSQSVTQQNEEKQTEIDNQNKQLDVNNTSKNSNSDNQEKEKNNSKVNTFDEQRKFNQNEEGYHKKVYQKPNPYTNSNKVYQSKPGQAQQLPPQKKVFQKKINKNNEYSSNKKDNSLDSLQEEYDLSDDEDLGSNDDEKNYDNYLQNSSKKNKYEKTSQNGIKEQRPQSMSTDEKNDNPSSNPQINQRQNYHNAYKYQNNYTKPFNNESTHPNSNLNNNSNGGITNNPYTSSNQFNGSSKIPKKPKFQQNTVYYQKKKPSNSQDDIDDIIQDYLSDEDLEVNSNQFKDKRNGSLVNKTKKMKENVVYVLKEKEEEKQSTEGQIENEIIQNTNQEKSQEPQRQENNTNQSEEYNEQEVQAQNKTYQNGVKNNNYNQFYKQNPNQKQYSKGQPPIKQKYNPNYQQVQEVYVRAKNEYENKNSNNGNESSTKQDNNQNQSQSQSNNSNQNQNQENNNKQNEQFDLSKANSQQNNQNQQSQLGGQYKKNNFTEKNKPEKQQEREQNRDKYREDNLYQQQVYTKQDPKQAKEFVEQKSGESSDKVSHHSNSNSNITNKDKQQVEIQEMNKIHPKRQAQFSKEDLDNQINNNNNNLDPNSQTAQVNAQKRKEKLEKLREKYLKQQNLLPFTNNETTNLAQVSQAEYIQQQTQLHGYNTNGHPAMIQNQMYPSQQQYSNQMYEQLLSPDSDNADFQIYFNPQPQNPHVQQQFLFYPYPRMPDMEYYQHYMKDIFPTEQPPAQHAYYQVAPNQQQTAMYPTTYLHSLQHLQQPQIIQNTIQQPQQQGQVNPQINSINPLLSSPQQQQPTPQQSQKSDQYQYSYNLAGQSYFSNFALKNDSKIDESLWYYIDNQGQEQGPFPSIQMDLWNFQNYFPNDLQIKFEKTNNWTEKKQFQIENPIPEDEEELHHLAFSISESPSIFSKSFYQSQQS